MVRLGEQIGQKTLTQLLPQQLWKPTHCLEVQETQQQMQYLMLVLTLPSNQSKTRLLVRPQYCMEEMYSQPTTSIFLTEAPLPQQLQLHQA
jgi:hypothetical protein